MKSVLRKAAHLSGVIALVLGFEIMPLFTGVASAASTTLTVNGSQKFQTMDGFGVSINAHSWDNGALKPVLDSLIDQNGSQEFRIVMEMTDWEQTNDNADPNTFNWDYYNPIYSGATSYDTAQNGSNFADLWNTIDYLHLRGIPDSQITLINMGIGPSWMGGATLNPAMEDEWVETVVSAAYYGYSHGHTFGMLSPDNEEDVGHNEGIVMSYTLYANAMNKVAQRLDALGMNDVRLLGPENTGGLSASYVNAMADYPSLMAKVDHLVFHNYAGTAGNAQSIASGAGKDFWVSEFSVFDQAFNFLSQGASGLGMWDAYDSVYNHAILNGLGNQPGNDPGNAPSLIAYNGATKVYTPRTSFYQFGQLFKYVPIGSVMIGSSSSNSAVHTAAFIHSTSGRFTLVGNNTSSSSQTLSISLANVPNLPSSLSYYQTNSGSNMAQGANVAVSGGMATVTVPANTVFTLTGVGITDTQAPTAPSNVTGNATSSTQATLGWTASTDNVGVSGYVVKRNGVVVGQPATTSYDDSGLTPNTTYTYIVEAKDASGNLSPDSNTVTITTPAAPVDNQAPSVPANLTATPGGSVQVNLTWAASTDNIGVTGYDVFRSGSQIATTTTTSYADTTVTAGNTYNYTVAAHDAAGNASANSTPASVTVPLTSTIWAPTVTPANPSENDTNAVELGVKFRSDVAGTISGVRFYKGASNAGIHVGHLWSSTGTQLASVTFSGETSSGWQQANFLTPVTIAANTTYIVSYYAPTGHYAADSNYFATHGVDNAPLHALGNGVDGTNGVYHYGSGGGFPSSSFQSTNYWVDAVFAPTSAPPVDTTAPTATIATPLDGSTVSGTQTVSISASDNVGVTKVEWYLDGALQTAKTSTPYSFSWDTRTNANGAHQITAKAYDAAGNVGSSTAANVTVLNDATPPSTPANLTATAVDQNHVNLTWDASTDDVGVTGYSVKRDGVTLAQVGTTGYSDATTVASTTYTYTVAAIDAAGNQSPVATATVTTPAPPADTQAPTIPGSPTATNITTTSATLAWTASTDNVGVTGYQILRDGTPIATTATLSYTDATLQPGTTYSYTVQAYDAAGNYSTAASPLSVTTITPDTTAPQVSVTAPTAGSTVSGSASVTASATDNVGVIGVQFKLDGATLGSEDTSNPYTISWNTIGLANGSHTLTAVARDAAGNTTTSALVTVTVSNTASPIATDVTVSTHPTAKSSTIISPAFSTTSTNELLVAFVSADGPAASAQSIKTLTGGGVTWTLQKRSNTSAGTSEIWTAPAPALLSNVKATATLNSGSYIGSITIVSLTHAQVGGATAGASAATGAPSLSLTTTQANSQVWAIGNDWDGATARTVGTSQTLIDQYIASSTGDTFWVQRLTNPVATAGTPVTINDSAPTNHRWNLAAIEILPAP